ncbi:MAG: FAD-dependent oxidoreductase [bacterium]
MVTSSDSKSAQLLYDVVINGSSFSAPAAALAAARAWSGARILLLESTDWLGGQATSQGVSAIDNAWHDPGASLMRDHPEHYYPADYRAFLTRIKSAPTTAPGEGMAPNDSAWVSREAYDPRTAAWVLDEMMAEQTSITVMKLSVVKEVQTTTITDEFGAARLITSLIIIQRIPANGYVPFSKFLSQEIEDWYNYADSPDFRKSVFTVLPRDPARGLVVIDASETADVIVPSEAVCTVGREKTTEVLGEDGSLPDIDENGSQATVYPFCMTDSPTTDFEDALKARFDNFQAYYEDQLDHFFSLGQYSWNRVWTYRRLRNTGATGNYDAVNRGDVTMQNWYPGNDYPYGSIYLDKTAAFAQASDWRGAMNLTQLAQAEKHAVAWYFFMKNCRTTSWDTHFLCRDDSLNMMGTGTGLAKLPYIRCARRIIGIDNFRLTSRYFVNTKASDYKGGTSFRFFDSVGIGNYTVDIHATIISTGMSPPFTYAAPFYIPYRALGSTNVRNLLAGGKLIASTYITNAAYRLHPIEWAIGSAAGSAAGLMSRDGKTNRKMLDIPDLRELQDVVVANSPISWAAFDSQSRPAMNGDLVVNDLKPVRDSVPFTIEVYHPRATRAKIYLQGVLIGETTSRANGRLLLEGVTAPAGSADFMALCLDDASKVIDILQSGPVRDLTIVDDSDTRFSTTGEWSVRTAQPNKYGSTYQVCWGTSQPSSATWKLHIPEPGWYEVEIWYPEAYNRATDAPFTVHHAGELTVISVNQKINGGMWFSLGNFQFNATEDEKLLLTNQISDTSLLVVADAVRVRPVPKASVSEWNAHKADAPLLVP